MPNKKKHTKSVTCRNCHYYDSERIKCWYETLPLEINEFGDGLYRPEVKVWIKTNHLDSSKTDCPAATKKDNQIISGYLYSYLSVTEYPSNQLIPKECFKLNDWEIWQEVISNTWHYATIWRVKLNVFTKAEEHLHNEQDRIVREEQNRKMAAGWARLESNMRAAEYKRQNQPYKPTSYQDPYKQLISKYEDSWGGIPESRLDEYYSERDALTKQIQQDYDDWNKKYRY